MMKKFGLLLILLLLPLSPVYPQSDSEYPPITTDNVHQLTEIARMGRGLINDMEWSPDGKWLAVATSNGVFVYDTSDWEQEPLALPGYKVAVSDSSWQPNGTQLVTIDTNAGVRLWNFDNTSPQEIDINQLPPDVTPEDYSGIGGVPYYQITYSESNRILIVSHCDSELCLWDAMPSAAIDASEYSVVSNVDPVIIDYRGERLYDRYFTYSSNLAIETLCAPSLNDVCQLIVHEKEILKELDTIIFGDVYSYDIGGVAVSDDFIAAGVSTSTIEDPLENPELRIIPLDGREEVVFPLEVVGEFIHEIDISPDGHQVVARTVRGIYIWDIENRQNVAILGGFGNGATEVVIHPSGDYLIAFHDVASSYPYGESITFWEIETWQHIHSMPAVGGFTLSPDGDTLYMSNYSFVGAQILPTLWDITDPASPIQLETPAYFENEMIYLPFSDFAFFEEEGILAGALNGGPSLVLWDIDTGEVLKHDACDGLGCKFIISADGSLIVMTASDYQQFVQRDDFLSEEYLNETGTWIMGYWTAISPTVEQIAVNTDFRTVTIYNRDLSERYQVTLEDVDNIFTLAYSHDGALLAVALCVDNNNLFPCKDTRIRFYETQGFELIHEIQALDTNISSLTFTPDGHYLFVGFGGSERVIDSLTDAKYISVYAVEE